MHLWVGYGYTTIYLVKFLNPACPWKKKVQAYSMNSVDPDVQSDQDLNCPHFAHICLF